MPPGRKPDAPGTYRIKLQPSGTFLLSGISTTGRRIKFAGLSYGDAERTAAEIFGQSGNNNVSPTIAPIVQRPAQNDDWGLPINVSVDTAAQVNSSLGVSPNAQTNPQPGAGPASKGVDAIIDSALTKAKRAKQAKSLMELAGISWAAGSVWVGRRVTDASGRDPVNPSPTQVKDLAEVTKETFIDWFGDYDLKPWQMMMLLSLGIPLSMFIQSPKKKVKPQADLKSVP
jgi:hypothetical protein